MYDNIITTYNIISTITWIHQVWMNEIDVIPMWRYNKQNNNITQNIIDHNRVLRNILVLLNKFHADPYTSIWSRNRGGFCLNWPFRTILNHERGVVGWFVTYNVWYDIRSSYLQTTVDVRTERFIIRSRSR